ncbi:methyltransferase-related [Anaeramoeba ignava]|uniref:tRNA N(3)-methylcytidine methyltransferase n=1 Tax=Anaeramoeba ignava TaxID=1746090 RepID=A0A9Q0R729_ANAIG|nr:methyltransferase-related [Anaeramoeba ignava]|eukprot:Anaeramoba_ignava/a611538_12.p1 GENE.a611538_12~~a611538_12.p1  ORF type:complete len:336 (+),score=95.20 a611538_12:113-1120(+)
MEKKENQSNQQENNSIPSLELNIEMLQKNTKPKKKEYRNLGELISRVTKQEMEELIQKQNTAGREIELAEIPEEYLAKAKKLLSEETTSTITERWANKYKEESSKFWDKFYKSNKDHAFKDRNYFYQALFEELLEKERFKDQERVALLDIGCGTGSTMFPLLRRTKKLDFYGIDLSPKALQLLKENPEFDSERVKNVFVHDITKSDIPDLPEKSFDIVTLIFTLSAIHPDHYVPVFRRLKKMLKPNGVIVFRDYAVYDLSQLRFNQKENKLSENLYVRWTGTLSYFFSTEVIAKIASETEFKLLKNQYTSRQILNRKKCLVMHRIWIEALFENTN